MKKLIWAFVLLPVISFAQKIDIDKQTKGQLPASRIDGTISSAAEKTPHQDKVFVNALTDCNAPKATGSGTCVYNNTSGCVDALPVLQACVVSECATGAGTWIGGSYGTFCNKTITLKMPKTCSGPNCIDWYLSDSLRLPAGVAIEGEGVGKWNASTAIAWPSGKTGLVGWGSNRAEHLSLYGGDPMSPGAVANTADAIQFSGGGVIIDVGINNFGRHGIMNASNETARLANSQFDGTHAKNVVIHAVRGDGIHSAGGDGGVGVFDNVKVYSAGGVSFYDDSLYGNTYISPLSTGSYGQAYKASRGTFIRPYAENENPGAFCIGTLCASAIDPQGIAGNAFPRGVLEGEYYGFKTFKSGVMVQPQTQNTYSTAVNKTWLGYDPDSSGIAAIVVENVDPTNPVNTVYSRSFLRRTANGNVSGWWGWQAVTGNPAGAGITKFSMLQGDQLTDSGRSNYASKPGTWFPNGIYLGLDGSNQSGLFFVSGSAAPTTGSWKKGDIVYNNNASAGGVFMWRCTVAGTPGTWEALSAGGLPDTTTNGIVKRTAANTTAVAAASDVAGLFTGSGYLKSDGTADSPAGTGTVTATGGTLTANQALCGAGGVDAKPCSSSGGTTAQFGGPADNMDQSASVMRLKNGNAFWGEYYSVSKAFYFASDVILGFSSGNPSLVAQDTGLTRCGAACMSLGNGTAANATGKLKVASVALTSQSAPTCDASTRGNLNHTDGAPGSRDVTQVCSKNAAGTYAWATVNPDEKVCTSTDKFSGYDPATGLFTCSADSGAAGGGVWGAITGTITDQTDLMTALNGRLLTSDLDSTLIISKFGSGSCSGYLKSDGSCDAGGGSMTWPAAAGIAVYGGSSAWGTSLTAPSGAIVGTTDAQSLTNKNMTGAGNTWPTFNQNTSGTAAGLSATLAVASGGTNLTASADDNTIVGNGTTWQSKALPACANATTSKLLYDTATNAFSCGTDQSGGTITVADTQVLFADGANTPAGDAGMTYNKTTDTLTVGAIVTTGAGYFNLTSQTDSTTTGDLWRNVELLKWRGASTTYTAATTADLAGYVPTTRTVAGKALSSNITLSCSDLSDDGSLCTSSAALPVTKTAVAGQPLLSYDSTTGAFTQAALTAANVGAVPTTRTVAGKALSGDITIACSDLSDDGGACTLGTGTLTDTKYCIYTTGVGLVCNSTPAGGLASTDIDTSAELRTILTDESGTGALLFAGGNIGAATMTSVNKVAITAPTTAGTIAFAADNSTATLPNGNVSLTVASGTSALGTSAISSGACATAVTTSATGTATTDVIWWGFNGDPTAVTGYAPTTNGMLTIIAYPSANNVSFKVCNNTSASVTPGAITLNWRVIR